MGNKEKVIVIVGPTAVGKTMLSVKLAEKFNGEIVSGDSMQIYRQLNIGTAKATKEEQRDIPHFLLDEIDLNENYSVSDFKKQAQAYIKDIIGRGKTPIIVGGTGLYIQALLFDFQLGGKQDLSKNVNQRRVALEEQADKEGKEVVWSYLESIDSPAAAVIHPNNLKRVIRAIEVKELTGKSIVEQTIDFKDLSQSIYDVKLLGLDTERAILYERINRRVDMMMKQGLLEEAHLLEKTPNVQAAQGIGYKEFFPYFKGELTLDEAVEQVKQNSRRYAKRQLTWFRNRMSVEWWDLVDDEQRMGSLFEEVSEWLQQLKGGD